MGGTVAERSILRSLATLLTGNVLAQAAPFLAAPILARLFDAPQFALFGAAMAIFNLMSVAVTARYEMAVMLPHDRGTAAHLLRGGLLIVVVTSILFLGALTLAEPWLSGWLGAAPPKWFVACLAALALLAGVQVLGQQWLLREGAFSQIAVIKVLQSLGITGATLALGWMGQRDGLLLGYLGGWALFAVATWIAVRRRRPVPGAWDLAASSRELRSQSQWPLHNLWPALLNALVSGSAVMLVTHFFDAGTAGQHNFTRQYVLGPISMLTVALGQVIYQRTSDHVKAGRGIKTELMTVARWLSLCALIMVLVIALGGPWLFGFLFGDAWTEAGSMSRILVWGYAAQLIASPFGMVLLALGRVKAAMIFPMLYALLMVIPAAMPGSPAGPFMAVLSGVEVVAYASYALLVAHHVSLYERRRPA